MTEKLAIKIGSVVRCPLICSTSVHCTHMDLNGRSSSISQHLQQESAWSQTENCLMKRKWVADIRVALSQDPSAPSQNNNWLGGFSFSGETSLHSTDSPCSVLWVQWEAPQYLFCEFAFLILFWWKCKITLVSPTSCLPSQLDIPCPVYGR